MSERYILASDIGSGGCKTILVNDEYKVVGSAQQEYPNHYPHPGWVEQDPRNWYEAFCTTVCSILSRIRINPHNIMGIGIVGVTHNCVLLDKKDIPLCPSILMFDTRSSAQVQKIIDRWGETVHERTLNDTTTTWSWPQLLWIKENRHDVWASTQRILFPKDYVRHRLAPSPVTDYIDATGTLLFDPIEQNWIEPFCEDLGLDIKVLPEVVNPFEIVSSICTQGAKDTGLRPGTPVMTGSTDTVAEVLGSGAVYPGSATVKLASVGRIAVVAKNPIRCHHVFNYRHVLDSLWYPGTASKYAASAYRWLRDVFWPGTKNNDIYVRMDKEAQKAPLGCNGLIFHPHLMGEWAPHWDDKLRGTFLGLTARHERLHFIRSVLEGVAFALRDAFSQLEEFGVTIKELRLIGQGSKSDLWARIVADVLNRKIHIPEQIDAVYGAALIAAIGFGLIERCPRKIQSTIRVCNTVEPNHENSSQYTQLYGIYVDADKAMSPISARLNAFENSNLIGSTL